MDKMGILSFFILVATSLFNPTYASSGKDRCKTIDCICYVNPGSITSAVASPLKTKRRNPVYFSEDSYKLSNLQISKIKSLRESIQESENITLMGYTDGCGSKSYNLNLSLKRAHSVKKIISEINPKARVKIVTGGENVQHHSAHSRKVDIITHTKNKFITRIEEIPADVYLIDGSGSMWKSVSEWKSLVNASFRPGSKIYMSMMLGCYNGQSLDRISPKGGTEIWYSYYTVLEKMKEGETLLIISDFKSNYSIQKWERETLERMVRKKNITVYTISP